MGGPTNSPKNPQQTNERLGQLYLSVKEGKSFSIAETSDVYCVLQIEKQHIQTSVCSKIAPNTQPTWNEGYNFDVTTPDAQMFVGVWAKTASCPNGKCMGSVSIPVKSIGQVKGSQQGANAQRTHVWVPLESTGHPGSQLRFDIYYNEVVQRVGLDDFTVLKQLGRGAFGDVMLVQKKDTGSLYAMKVCKKDKIISMDAVDLALKERNLIKSFNHPFVVNLKFSFKTKRHLFLIMDYIGGGELFYHMAEQRAFQEDVVQFYAAQLVLALSFLHEHNIIYRDLKPENLLLDIRGNICLCDFGLCKEMAAGDLAYTLCGSTEYMSPEALRGHGYGKEVDWWALGVVLFEMLSGRPLFSGNNKADIHESILYGPIPFSDTMSKDAMSLILNLLKRDPAKRLGAGSKGSEDIKSHPFFEGIDWKKILHKQIEPPFKPHLVGAMDLKYFDPACTESPVPELSASPRLDTFDECFGSFSYVAPVEVFKSDQGISFLKGASFGKLPLFPHLDRTHSVSPISWNPLVDSHNRNSPRLAHSGHSFYSAGSASPHSPHMSIMMASTPPPSTFELNVSTPPVSPRSPNTARHNPGLTLNLSSLDQGTLIPSPPSPTALSSTATSSNRLRRPFSLPDNSSPSPRGSRLGPSTIGHTQSRQLRHSLSDYDNDDDQEQVMMQQKELSEEDMGITPRGQEKAKRQSDGSGSEDSSEKLKSSGESEKEGSPKMEGAAPAKAASDRSIAQSAPLRPMLRENRRPSLRDIREAKKEEARKEKVRENEERQREKEIKREATHIRNSAELRKKKSFKDLVSGFFSKEPKESNLKESREIRTSHSNKAVK